MKPIYNYTDYRKYFRDYAKEYGYTYAEMTCIMNYKSSSYYSELLKGTRGLPDRGLVEFSLHNRFNLDEHNYFMAMVHSCDTRIHSHKVFYRKIMRMIKASL